jgi:hypothetical protein
VRCLYALSTLTRKSRIFLRCVGMRNHRPPRPAETEVSIILWIRTPVFSATLNPCLAGSALQSRLGGLHSSCPSCRLVCPVFGTAEPAAAEVQLQNAEKMRGDHRGISRTEPKGNCLSNLSGGRRGTGTRGGAVDSPTVKAVQSTVSWIAHRSIYYANCAGQTNWNRVAEKAARKTLRSAVSSLPRCFPLPVTDYAVWTPYNHFYNGNDYRWI